MEKFVEDLVTNANDLLWSSVLIVVLVALGLYFTVRMGSSSSGCCLKCSAFCSKTA